MSNGLIHLYHGDGKGKTTAAMGLAVRALGCGRRVVIVQFLKGGATGELEPLQTLGATFYRGKAGQKFVFQMNEEEKPAPCTSLAHRRKAGSGNGGSPHWQQQDGGSTAPPERAGSGAVSRFPVRPAPSFPPLPAPCAERGGIHGQRRHNNAPHSAAHWSCGSSAIRCAARCRLVPSLLLPLTRARDHAPSRAVHTVTYKLTCAYSGSPAAHRSNGCRCSLPPPALQRCLRRQQAAALRHPRRTHQS